MKCSIYQPSYYHVAISWCPKTRTTYCLLVVKIDNTHQFSLLVEAILGSSALISSPLCVAVHLIDTCVQATQSRLVGVDGALNELEEVTGQHEWANRPMGDPMAMDFLKVGRKLNFNSRTLVIEKKRAQTLLSTIQEVKRIVDGCNSEVAQLLRYHENACHMQVCSIDYQDRRVQSQLAVVYQFMSQKDSKTNIELAASSASIAKETKRDGTAMKTIAILTMFFLPGTFLAVRIRTERCATADTFTGYVCHAALQLGGSGSCHQAKVHILLGHRNSFKLLGDAGLGVHHLSSLE